MHHVLASQTGQGVITQHHTRHKAVSLHLHQRRLQTRLRQHFAAPGHQQSHQGFAQVLISLQKQNPQALQIGDLRATRGRHVSTLRLRRDRTGPGYRKRHRKTGTAAQRRTNRQCGTQHVGCASHDVQPQAHAFRNVGALPVNPVKLLEDLLMVRGVDSTPAVEHLNAHPGSVVHRAADNQHSALAGVAQRVMAQIHHHPLQQSRISQSP